MDKLYLGIEFGSTRIKSVLINEKFETVAVGNHDWENRYENGVWTYHLDDIWTGLQASYASMTKAYGKPITQLSGMGLSAMMHGYMPMNAAGELLTEFRTWRNTSTGAASEKLRKLFGHNIPLRWSIAHLYQAILNGEQHVKDISLITTLAGFVHYKLTGQKVLGIGDASGVFPLDCEAGDYNQKMVADFDALIADKQYPWKISDIMPKIQYAGEVAGQLTAEGAKLLDPSGKLQAGIPFCPPEGDAGTGMTATNSIAALTGNVSAGTSIFAMVVLQKPLSRVYPELDIVTTPDGKPVAMVHCNNGTSDINGWVQMFAEIVSAHTGQTVKAGALFEMLYRAALNGDADGGGLMSCNYLSGEHNTGFDEGRPLFVRMPDASFTLANFMRTMLLSAMASLKLGMDILAGEGVLVKQLLGHGGFFKTQGVAQKLMAGALNTPVAVMETAGEGGAWGLALLAAYLDHNKESLDNFLNNKVFANLSIDRLEPSQSDTDGFKKFMKSYEACLKIERTAVEEFRD